MANSQGDGNAFATPRSSTWIVFNCVLFVIVLDSCCWWLDKGLSRVFKGQTGFEFWVLRFRDLGASCLGLYFRVLRFRNYPAHAKVVVVNDSVFKMDRRQYSLKSKRPIFIILFLLLVSAHWPTHTIFPRIIAGGDYYFFALKGSDYSRKKIISNFGHWKSCFKYFVLLSH